MATILFGLCPLKPGPPHIHRQLTMEETHPREIVILAADGKSPYGTEPGRATGHLERATLGQGLTVPAPCRAKLYRKSKS
jgi:hypothetical protein